MSLWKAIYEMIKDADYSGHYGYGIGGHFNSIVLLLNTSIIIYIHVYIYMNMSKVEKHTNGSSIDLRKLMHQDKGIYMYTCTYN